MGAAETIVDMITDNRTYYNCPNCGREVWAYGSFAGNVCWNCPGTLGHALIKTTDLATMGMTSTVIDTIVDNKTTYRCPSCGCEKWAYGVGIGRICLKCQEKGNFSIDMKGACDMEVSLNDFLNYYYNNSGTVVTIDGKTFTNVVPRSNLENAKYYSKVSDSYVCGLNAINICSKIWNYNKQLKQCNYKYNTAFGQKYGKHYDEFYDENIAPHFWNSGWKGDQHVILRQNIDTNWSYIDGTNFKTNSLIILGGKDYGGHFQVVLGVDTEKQHYLIIDQSLKVWLVDMSLFRLISHYVLTKGLACLDRVFTNSNLDFLPKGFYVEHSIYRIGKN